MSKKSDTEAKQGSGGLTNIGEGQAPGFTGMETSSVEFISLATHANCRRPEASYKV